ncbi:hypothetical protein [Nocardia sp. NPDC050718]|uniref:hypothetical protein n=1 Tax=Nocardia sp. NPDC050718 TaxID=3155788 RepID=UPI0033E6F823
MERNTEVSETTREAVEYVPVPSIVRLAPALPWTTGLLSAFISDVWATPGLALAVIAAVSTVEVLFVHANPRTARNLKNALVSRRFQRRTRREEQQ